MNPAIQTINNQAIDIDLSEADDKTLLWLTNRDSEKELSNILLEYALSENKILLIWDEIQLVGLGKISVNQFMERVDNLIFEIEGTGKDDAIQSLVLYVLGHISKQVLARPENAEFYSLEKSTDVPDPLKPTTASVLSELATQPHDNPHEDRDDLISAIENPTPTVATPSFTLPNTKPNTSDILKNLTKPSGSIPATMPTAFPPELDLSLDTADIIDPFKTTTPTTLQTGISAQIDLKLSNITGSTTKESFKTMPLSETMKNLAANQSAVKKSDPYREPIE